MRTAQKLQSSTSSVSICSEALDVTLAVVLDPILTTWLVALAVITSHVFASCTLIRSVILRIRWWWSCGTCERFKELKPGPFFNTTVHCVVKCFVGPREGSALWVFLCNYEDCFWLLYPCYAMPCLLKSSNCGWDCLKLGFDDWIILRCVCWKRLKWTWLSYSNIFTGRLNVIGNSVSPYVLVVLLLSRLWFVIAAWGCRLALCRIILTDKIVWIS